MKLRGKTWKFENDIDTDAIIPARYLNTTMPEELARNCMKDIKKNFYKIINKGDIIIAGKNFGCGSSREHAPISIKSVGISCIIAESFARIFYRNSINIGLLILESKEASKNIKEGDIVEIDTYSGKIKNITKKQIYKSTPFPPFMQELIKVGGLVSYIKNKTKEE